MEKKQSIKELYAKALQYRIEDAEVKDVEGFVLMAEKSTRHTALCGWCKNRNTSSCPFPHEAKITYPACNSFEPREKQEDNETKPSEDN